MTQSFEKETCHCATLLPTAAVHSSEQCYRRFSAGVHKVLSTPMVIQLIRCLGQALHTQKLRGVRPERLPGYYLCFKVTLDYCSDVYPYFIPRKDKILRLEFSNSFLSELTSLEGMKAKVQRKLSFKLVHNVACDKDRASAISPLILSSDPCPEDTQVSQNSLEGSESSP